jgi:superoxide dismutase, Cu-Zn family
MRRFSPRYWFLFISVAAVSFSFTTEKGVTAARVAKAEIAETKPVIPVTRAVAALNPTKNNKAHGTVHFKAVEGGILITADMEGLTPGKHGFHIHEFGDCSAPDAMSAGAHFNPTHMKHGGPDYAERHVGDLGNIVANQNGYAHYERVDTIIQLNGPDTIVGRSLIVHASADDFTSQPAGNAGARISCGIIEAQ